MENPLEENISQIRKLSEIISESRHILLLGHMNPDGDSVGAVTGMAGILKTMGREAVTCMPNLYPSFLSFLDPDGRMLFYSEEKNRKQIKEAVSEADLIIAMDFNSFSRLDSLGKVIKECAGSKCRRVMIDHHPQPDGDFDVSISRIDLSSTCEIAFWISLLLTGKKNIPAGCAVSFYTGMMTDTNNFANSVVPSTFSMANLLMLAGVDKEKIENEVLGSYSYKRMSLMGFMLYRQLKIYEKEGAAVMVLTQEIKDKFGFAEGDSEGFVNLALGIKGVKVSAMFTESKDFLRVSLRSKGDFSVNRLAREYFNGGGHERAAGGKLFMPVDKVEDYFIGSLRRFIKSKENKA
ncbi:MAG: DHH family phosphoesterase [Bacteroidales bacterium]|jgi:phosphoesterase RecJ-like protein|nr:DHH family phosphoesterase [Bacteroidales bacterium]